MKTLTDGSGSRREIERIRRIAENTHDEEACKTAMLILVNINPTYHWCPDWDYMVICDKSPEFAGCNCKLQPS